MVPATSDVEKQLDAVLAQIGLTQPKANKAA
jgi:hypothetical protein